MISDEEFRQHQEAWKRNNHFHAERIKDMKAEEDRLNKEIDRLRRLLGLALEGLKKCGEDTMHDLIKNAMRVGGRVDEQK